jgi:hypothetical protein
VFERDISIFGQSGGRTFREAGMYELQAELALGVGQVLRSNVIQVNVLDDSALDEKNRTLLRNPWIQRLLFHKETQHRRMLTQFSAELLDQDARRINQGIHYALARAFHRPLARSRPAKSMRERALRHADASLSRPDILGRRQEHHMRQVILSSKR